MRSYRSQFARNFIDSRVGKRVEGRDAVVWDVDLSNQVCRCKIQGTDEYIIAHFPRNWRYIPYWLKRGNAVRISHRSGVRGYVEVIGEGRAIPTPVTGTALPTPQGQPDMIVSGCGVTPTAPVSMSVVIAAGTFRIGGTLYTLAAPVTKALSAAPAAGSYRYDLLCIGADSVVDYIAGTPASSDPVKPLVPGGHVLLAYILVKGGATVITSENIGETWTAPYACMLALTYDPTFEWDGLNTTPEMNVTATIKDQYGQTLSVAAGSQVFTLEKSTGTGLVWSLDSGYQAASVSQVAGNTYTFKYQRDQAAAPEHSPVLRVGLAANGLSSVAMVTLLDNVGNPIY